MSSKWPFLAVLCLELDAEEEFENVARRKRREERKQQERIQKRQLARQMGIGGQVNSGFEYDSLGQKPQAETGSIDSLEKRQGGSSRASSASEHQSVSSSNKSSLKQHSSSSGLSGNERKEVKSVQIKEKADQVCF